jgi:hypothetical protein
MTTTTCFGFQVIPVLPYFKLTEYNALSVLFSLKSDTRYRVHIFIQATHLGVVYKYNNNNNNKLKE